ncbi:MAG TPA: ADOP family duplicated permease [Dyella sp.]|nr:ADOP family duplicated permease [Dyella sp.]
MNIWLHEIWRAGRANLRRPGFLLLATGVLALGIGASAAVFALIEGTLLKPLPYPQAERLVAVGMMTDYGAATSPELHQHLTGMQGVQSIGIVTSLAPSNVMIEGRALQVPTMLVDHDLLPTLGIRMTLGRGFTEAEDQPGGPSVVMLGHTFWTSHYGGNPGVLGQNLTIEGKPHTIVGVLPAGFDLLGRIFELTGDVDVVLPTALPANSRDDGTNYMSVARLAPGVGIGAVAAQVNARARALIASAPLATSQKSSLLRQQFTAISLQRQMHVGARGVLLLFQASALLVLLIALVNLGNLMMLRSLARSHDGAVRRALGASLWRECLPALADALLIGVCASLVGVLLAWASLHVLRHVVSSDVVDLHAAVLDTFTIVLALCVGVAAAVIAAALGLWRSRKLIDMDQLREGGRSGLGRANQRLGRVLVVTQVVLATSLLLVAGLFLHALYNAAHAQLGFSDQRILTMELAPVKASYPDAASVQQLALQVLDQLRAQPGVEGAVASTNLPVGQQLNLPAHAPGQEPSSMQFRAISPDFFATFGIALRQGRAFDTHDMRGGETVAIINSELADHVYGGRALGKLIDILSGPDMVEARIVGVVQNTSQYGPLGPQPPIVYLPLAQTPDKLIELVRSFQPMHFAIRVRGDALSYRAAMRDAVARVAPTQPTANIRTLASIVESTTADAQLDLLLIGVFAVLALVLASAGLYAVMAVSVAAREREIGVRMALGSSSTRLLAWVLRSGVAQVFIGLGIGVVLTLAASRLLRELMFDTLGNDRAFDPWTLLGVAVLLLAAGVLACLLPALRAARVQPMRALRGE